MLHCPRGTLRVKKRYKSTVHILSCILCVSFWQLIWCKDKNMEALLSKHPAHTTKWITTCRIYIYIYNPLHYTILPWSISVSYLAKIRRPTAVLKFQFKMPGVTIPWGMPFLAAASVASLPLIPIKLGSKTMLYSRHKSDSCCTAVTIGWVR